MVQLPIRKDKLRALESSYDIALKRFLSLERKLKRQPETKKVYGEFMQEYLKLGHKHPIVLDTSETVPSFYMPHHAVFNENNSTSRIRVVFDASCKTDSGLSLNDVLMIGPTLQQDLLPF